MDKRSYFFQLGRNIARVITLSNRRIFFRFLRRSLILLNVFLLMVLTSACAITNDNNNTPIIIPPITPSTMPIDTETHEDGIQEDHLITYIVQELAGVEQQHRYVALVSTQDSRAPLPITQSAIQQCWLFQNGELLDCQPADFTNSLAGESQTSWNYSYSVFAIIAVNAENTEATIRLDELSGPSTSQGILYTLERLNEIWTVLSRRILWSG